MKLRRGNRWKRDGQRNKLVSRSQTNKIRSLFLFVVNDDLLICSNKRSTSLPIPAPHAGPACQFDDQHTTVE
jgi:hypothetical protein